MSGLTGTPTPPPARQQPLVWALVAVLVVSLVGLVALFAWPRGSGQPAGHPSLAAPPVTAPHPTAPIASAPTAPPASAKEPSALGKAVADVRPPASFGTWGTPVELAASGPTVWQRTYTSPDGTAVVSALRGDTVAHAVAGTSSQVDSAHARCGATSDDVRCAIALRDGIVVAVLPASMGTALALETSDLLVTAL